jgi:hypothetical protein
MMRRLAFAFKLQKRPRFISFDAGIVAGLLGIGIYLAILSRHWIATVFLALGVLFIVAIPIRLWTGKSNGPDAPNDPGTD